MPAGHGYLVPFCKQTVRAGHESAVTLASSDNDKVSDNVNSRTVIRVDVLTRFTVFVYIQHHTKSTNANAIHCQHCQPFVAQWATVDGRTNVYVSGIHVVRATRRRPSIGVRTVHCAAHHGHCLRGHGCRFGRNIGMDTCTKSRSQSVRQHLALACVSLR